MSKVYVWNPVVDNGARRREFIALRNSQNDPNAAALEKGHVGGAEQKLNPQSFSVEAGCAVKIRNRDRNLTDLGEAETRHCLTHDISESNLFCDFTSDTLILSQLRDVKASLGRLEDRWKKADQTVRVYRCFFSLTIFR